MITARRLALTAAVAVYLLVVLVGFMTMTGPYALLGIPAMVGAGYMASDWIGKIWKLDGQYDDGRV